MAWIDEKSCYEPAVVTPLWITAFGIITSVIINSFILFSGESLTSKLMDVLKQYFCWFINMKCNKWRNSNDQNEYFPHLIKIKYVDNGESGYKRVRLETIDYINVQTNKSLSLDDVCTYFKRCEFNDKTHKYDIPYYKSTSKTLKHQILILHYDEINFIWKIETWNTLNQKPELFQRLNDNNDKTFSKLNKKELYYLSIRQLFNKDNEYIWKICDYKMYRYNMNLNANVSFYNTNNDIETILDNNVYSVKLNNFPNIFTQYDKEFNIDINGKYINMNYIEGNETKTESFSYDIKNNDSNKSLKLINMHLSCYLTQNKYIQFRHEKKSHLVLVYFMETPGDLTKADKSFIQKLKTIQPLHTFPKISIIDLNMLDILMYLPNDIDVNNDSNINNYRIINWIWNDLYTLKISNSRISYYTSQTLGLIMLSMGLWQWIHDITRLVNYIKEGNTHWNNYQCYAFIAVNSPNFKQFMSIWGLIYTIFAFQRKLNWFNDNDVNTRKELDTQKMNAIMFLIQYMVKMNLTNKVLLCGYGLSFIISIPAIITHFLIFYVSMWIILIVVLVFIRKIYHCVKFKKEALIDKNSHDNNQFGWIKSVQFVNFMAASLVGVCIGYMCLLIVVPTLGRLYGGYTFIDAIKITLTERKTSDYWESLKDDWNQVRQMFLWMF